VIIFRDDEEIADPGSRLDECVAGARMLAAGRPDHDALGDAELQEIVLTHNLTPRNCLGFLTPLQALLAELGRDVQIRFA
jgi:hypothetical protein